MHGADTTLRVEIFRGEERQVRSHAIFLCSILLFVSCSGRSPGLTDHRLGKEPVGDELNREAVLVKTKKPVYPEKLRRKFIEGYVIVAFRISETGEVLEPRVVFSTPKSVFDQYAIDAATKWRYEPKRVNGVPVEVPINRSLVAFCLQRAQFPSRWIRPKVCRGKKEYWEAVEELGDVGK